MRSAARARYARALADVVTGPAAVDPQQILRELRQFHEALAGSPQLRIALSSPAVSPARKRSVIDRLAGLLELSRVARNFLMVLADHRRAAELEGIIEAFEGEIDERLGFARVEVKSARELSAGQRDALDRKLQQLTGRKPRARYSVDPSLIGGVVASIGSVVYDGSVRGQLAALERRLTAE